MITNIVATIETIYWILDNGGKLHIGQTDPGLVTSTSNPVFQSTDEADIVALLEPRKHRMKLSTAGDEGTGFVVVDGVVSYRPMLGARKAEQS
jgi:hypothetical protein